MLIEDGYVFVCPWGTIQDHLIKLHLIVTLCDVYLTLQAQLTVDVLGDLPQTTELIKTVLEHFEVQLQLVYVLVQREHVVGATLRFVQS